MNEQIDLSEYAASLNLQLDEDQKVLLNKVMRCMLDCMADPPKSSGVFICATGNMAMTYSLGASHDEAVHLVEASVALLTSDRVNGESKYLQ